LEFPFWLRVLLTAILTLLLLALMIAFLPGILIWPVYPDNRRKWLLELIPHLVEWLRHCPGTDTTMTMSDWLVRARTLVTRSDGSQLGGKPMCAEWSD
jgi:hypothetical protein